MEDRGKTKEQLIEELAILHHRISDLEILVNEHNQAKEALRIAQQNFRNSTDNLPLGILVLDDEDIILYANQSILNIFGYDSPDEFKTIPKEQRYTPESLRVLNQRHLMRRDKKPLPSNYEVDIIRKDGKIRNVKVFHREVFWNGEKERQTLWQDITERKQAEKALQESEEKLRRVFESVSNGIVVTSFNGDIIDLNESALRLSGYNSKSDLLGKSAFETIAVGDRQRAIANMQQLLQEGIAGTAEFTLLKADGSEYPAEITADIVRDAYGVPIGFISVITDITSRWQAMKELRESELKYRELAESISDVFFAFDENLKYTYWNKASEKLTGVSAEEAIGKHIYDIFPRDEQIMNAEKLYLKVLATNEPQFLVSRYTLDGRDYVFTINAYRSKGGVSVFVKDITEHINAAEKLQESEQRYRAIVNLGGEIGEAIIMLQDTGRGEAIQTFVSDVWTHITGYSQEELLGMSFIDLVHPDSRQASLERHREKMNGKDIPGYFEMIIIKKDGTEVPIELTSAYTQYEGERANVAFIRDITERKKAEERERQLQEELTLSSRLASIGELAAGVAHELNNPLTAVLGYSERLLKNDYDQNTISGLEKIHREALRASKVIENLITFARRREPKKEYSDINNIVQTALELRAYELKTSNIEVEVELTEDLPEVMADFHQMEQVFLNIILNAEQAMTETQNGGKLTIKTQRLKNAIRISFSDNGPGIPEENIDKIFDPFFTTRENKAGTGLGLSICHGIVQEHSGKIYARSKPGKGVAFFIEIPLKNRAVKVSDAT